MLRPGKAALLVTGVSLVAACGSNDPLRDARREAQMQASIEETYLYIEANELEAVNHLRFQDPFRYEYHNDQFVIVETYAGPYLVEMRRRCPDLSSRDIYVDMADIRSNQNMIRAGIDTIRGCRIENIYKLPADAEQGQPAEAAGDDNEQDPLPGTAGRTGGGRL